MRNILLAFSLLFFTVPLSGYQRGIVSLDLCSDWMLLKLARADQVKAYSPLLYGYPADWVPSGLPQHDGSLEQIMRLEPELVVSGEYNALVLRKRLQRLGVEVRVVSLPLNLHDIADYQRDFMDLLGLPQETQSLALPERFPANNRRMLILGANGIGAGKKTMENDLLVHAGWTNYVQVSGHVNLSLEQLAMDPPEAVYYTAPTGHSLANLFAAHKVIKRDFGYEDRLAEQSWRWHCPGPWTTTLISDLVVW